MADQFTHSFYPLKRYWIERGLVPVLFLLFLGIVLIISFNPVVGIVWALMAGIWFHRDFQPLRQTYLEINKDTLSGYIDHREIHLFWQDVLVAQQTGALKQGYIYLRTDQTTFTIPLQLLDGDQLWQIIKIYVPPSALEAEAYKKLPAYQEYQQERASVIHTLAKPLRAGYFWGIKVMAWGCLLFSAWATIELFREVGFSSDLWLPGAFFVASGFAIYTFSKHIEMSSNAIAVVSWLGRKEMSWAEIQSVKYGYSAGLVLFSDNKVLKVTAPVNWFGVDAKKMVDFLDAQIEQRQIERYQIKQKFPFRS